MSKVFYIVVVFVLALIFVWFNPAKPEGATVDDKEVKTAGTFDECVKEGNPIQESYPPVCVTKDGKSITQNIGNEMILKDKIIIKSPRPVEKVKSPLKISGDARGMWFFEAQFSAKMLNDKGEVIGEGIMTADQGWMTEEFVPFSGEMVFDAKDSTRGKLILEKSNPSGLVENNETLIVPVVFR